MFGRFWIDKHVKLKQVLQTLYYIRAVHANSIWKCCTVECIAYFWNIKLFPNIYIYLFLFYELSYVFLYWTKFFTKFSCKIPDFGLLVVANVSFNTPIKRLFFLQSEPKTWWKTYSSFDEISGEEGIFLDFSGRG